ncbi:auxin-induced in root cultures protein 12-like [Pyrus ussuriensis x Pyrus communis]|uniref:Auxin-induced in root cultures protein 12-like n=1 Tax=Pyrus ussuriensis x Pyrus communis TaxID=2448454 RepID=A0A5N5IBZ4_9ROSA|nr:auxin-induced in root cultures protein 12-like [Pyrus ussuriensis x Pyrus communis]
MASSLPLSLLLQISCISLLLALLISPAAQAATCTSQTFKNNKVYSNCNDLPDLNSYLHWTYNRSNSSLSIAFVATPAKTGGWVAWAINPTAEKMLGSQALLAHPTTDGTPLVKTYNISSYSSIIQGNLSFDVWDISAEFSNSTYMIFATVKVPENATSVNQVWQVGPGVNTTTGLPERHDLAPANRRSYAPLNLVANGTTNSTTNTTSGALRTGSGGNMGLFSVLLLVLGALIAF